MDIFDAVASRYSCWAFLPKPVPEKIVRDIVEAAARAPSAGNLQPWRVYAIAGKRLAALKALLAPRMASELPKGEGVEYQIYPNPMPEPYRERAFTVGELLYQSIGVPREDRAARYGNLPATTNSSARRRPCSSPATSRMARRSGPTSAAICKPWRSWRAATACTPAHSRPGCRFTAPCGPSSISPTI